MRGRFITFEGGEGSGKSTQAALLAERLRACGIVVRQTREPGGSPGAEIIRHILLSGGVKPLGAEAEAVLFAAARSDHLDTLIRPALARGEWVVCDRFFDSTRVYQGAVGKVDPRIIRALERITVGDTRPDLTFILDVPVAIGLQRAAARSNAQAPDRFEKEKRPFHDLLRQAYLALAREEPERCVLIEATGQVAEVAAHIWHIVEARLHPGKESLDLEEAAP